MRRRFAKAGLFALALIGAGWASSGAQAAAPRAAPPASAPPAAPQPRAARGLETGLWELRPLGGESAPFRLCLGDLRQLFQPMHPMPLCRHFVTEDVAERSTVSYDCVGRGQGRTTLRVETARLVQIESQGVSDGRPFSAVLEGRRVGVCQGPASMARGKGHRRIGR